MSKKRRTKIEIIRDILKILTKYGGGVKKTKIVYGANLNFDRASSVLNWLIEAELVVSVSDTYKITEKGEEALREIDNLVALLTVS